MQQPVGILFFNLDILIETLAHPKLMRTYLKLRRTLRVGVPKFRLGYGIFDNF